MENSKIIIGCDIGGVLKTVRERTLIPNAIESVKKLSKKYKVVLISKTKDKNHPDKSKFLKDNDIEYLTVDYCETFEGKIDLALKNKINYMIDDKMEVLSILPEHINKIWFCPEKNYDVNEKDLSKVNAILVKNWEEIMKIFANL